MIGICVNVNNPDLFFRFLKGRYHGNRLYGKIWGYILSFGRVAFENGSQCSHSDSKIFN